MTSLSEMLAGLGNWNWFIVAVVLFVLEMIVPGVHFLWFGLAAVIVGGIALATGIAWQWQLIAFALIAIVTVFLVRRFADPKSVSSDEPDLNVRGAQYIGRSFIVAKALTEGRGKISDCETIWNSEGEEAPAGAVQQPVKPADHRPFPSQQQHFGLSWPGHGPRAP